VKRALLLALLLSALTKLQAQEQKKDREEDKIGTITGKIIDSSSHSPLEYATVTLYAKGNSTPVDGVTTSSSGHFQLTNVAPGSYRLVVESISYEAVTIDNITVSERNFVVDLKNIGLAKKAKSMEAVVVTSQAKVIDNKIDKLVFNAEKDITSQTGVATDVLKKVPQVSVDVDGNVELAGNSSIRFLINGKPSTAFGSNIADVLQAIPANQIKSIEVITNPGAKYDAEGIGGIINIILKKSTARGINGNVSLTAGTRMDNGSFNFNARKGKLAFNAFLSGNIRPTVNTPTTYTRLSTDSLGRNVLLEQNGSGDLRRGGYQSGIGFDYTINEKNSISASFGCNHFESKRNGVIDQSQIVAEQGTNTPVSDVESLNITKNVFDFYEKNAGVNYKKTFAKEDQELNISANTSFGNYKGSSSNLLFLKPNDSLYYGTQGVNPQKENETEIAVDYTQPIQKKVIFGTGGKFVFRNIASNADVQTYQPESKGFLPDPYLTNSLDYHQKVYAFYGELSFPVANLFDAKIGGRYERTNIDAFYSNAPKTDIPGYNTFVPSVFLSKKIGDKDQIKLSYSKRIERPDAGDLDPFINTSDPKNISTGNPYLKPEIGNRFELGYNIDLNKTGSIMVSAFYRTSDHDIQSYLVYYPSLKVGDSVYTNVSVNTRENIGLEKDLGINFFTSLRIADKLNLRANFFTFKRNTINTIDPGYNASSLNFRSNINLSYQFTNTLAAEFFGNFNSARHEVQGKYPSFTSYSFAIRKQFWNKNGSLALTTVDPFNEYVKQETVLHGPGFVSTSIRKIPFRSFGLNFTWKFGKLEFKKDKEENSPNLNAPAE
jgi:outer membrane receptor protein involved in Fe transport